MIKGIVEKFSDKRPRRRSSDSSFSDSESLQPISKRLNIDEVNFIQEDGNMEALMSEIKSLRTLTESVKAEQENLKRSVEENLENLKLI